MLEIVAASGVREGAEVHNTYGEYGNSELVNKYGFALQDNPFDCLQLCKSDLADYAERHLGAKEWRRRSMFLQRHSDLLEDDDEPFQVKRGAVVSLSLLATLRCAFAPAQEFKRFRDVMDVLRAPPTAGQRSGDMLLDPEQEVEYCVADVAHMLSPESCAALCVLCTTRLSRYPAPLQASLDAYKALQAGEGAGAAAGKLPGVTAAAAAERAAMLLRIGEQQVLQELLEAVQRIGLGEQAVDGASAGGVPAPNVCSQEAKRQRLK